MKIRVEVYGWRLGVDAAFKRGSFVFDRPSGKYEDILDLIKNKVLKDPYYNMDFYNDLVIRISNIYIDREVIDGGMKRDGSIRELKGRWHTFKTARLRCFIRLLAKGVEDEGATRFGARHLIT